jgi:hypothetical protein
MLFRYVKIYKILKNKLKIDISSRLCKGVLFCKAGNYFSNHLYLMNQKTYPGSEIVGVPASLIKAISSPFFR